MYRDAAVALGVKPQLAEVLSDAELVAEGLHAARSSAATTALVGWAARSNADPKHRLAALARILRAPDAVALPALRAALGEPEFGGHILTDAPGAGFFADVVRSPFMQCNTYCAVLDALAKIGSIESRALLEQIASDETRNGPNPKTLAAFSCEEGAVVDQAIATVLASERLWAVSYLHDRALLERLGADANAPAFARDFCRRVLERRPYPRGTGSVVRDEPIPGGPAPCRVRSHL